jgi:hypothetical protein
VSNSGGDTLRIQRTRANAHSARWKSIDQQHRRYNLRYNQNPCTRSSTCSHFASPKSATP